MRVDPLKALIRNGIRVSSYTVRAARVRQGRFAEEINADVVIEKGACREDLLHMKIFTGRPPYYRPWIEVFGIAPEPRICGKTIKYFDSPVEDVVLKTVADALEGGERLFVEYYRDVETMKALELGVPPPATRLGHKLFVLGFTWFKDWYFPEGFMEGGPKLQAEKALNEYQRNEALRKILGELEAFVESNQRSANEYVLRSVERARQIIKQIRAVLAP